MMGNRIEVDNEGNVTCIIEDVAVQLETEALIAENADLRREIALNEPLIETLNAANDALLAENAELRKRIEVLELHELGCGICKDEAVRQNAELRELVRDMWRTFMSGKTTAAQRAELRKRLGELGMEVDA